MSSSSGDRLERFHLARELYRGDFLESFCRDSSLQFEEWQLGHHHRLRSRYASILEDLAAQLLRCGERDTAVQAFEALLRIDPFDEAVHRRIVRLHGEAGRFVKSESCSS